MVRCRTCGRKTEKREVCMFCGSALYTDNVNLYENKQSDREISFALLCIASALIVAGIIFVLCYTFLL